MILFSTQLGSGKPIVIIHGFLGTSDNWYSLAKELSADYQVTLLDLRNHGRSQHSEDFNYDFLADDLHETLTDLKIENPVLIGHSMGGKTVMNYSIRYKDQFDRLIIVDIAPRYYPVHHQQILDGLLSIDLDTLKSRSDADEQLSKYVNDISVRQFLLKNLDRTKNGFNWKANISLFARKIENVGKETFSTDVSMKPVFFIKGDRSDYIRTDDKEKIRTMYPSAKILTIKNSGHWVHAEQPEVILSIIRGIITSGL